MKTLLEQIRITWQTVFYKKVYKENGNKFMLEIASDDYDFQCYAKVYVWSGIEKGWILVARLENMETESELRYKVNDNSIDNKKYFEKDIAKLENIAKEIVE